MGLSVFFLYGCMIDLVQLSLNMSEQAVSSTKLPSIIYFSCTSTAHGIPHANKLLRTALVWCFFVCVCACLCLWVGWGWGGVVRVFDSSVSGAQKRYLQRNSPANSLHYGPSLRGEWVQLCEAQRQTAREWRRDSGYSLLLFRSGEALFMASSLSPHKDMRAQFV